MRSILAFLFSLALAPAALAAPEDLWSALASGGHVALMRHALAPGTGDPPSFRLGDCSTQRNLSEGGRAEARAIGRRFQRAGVKVARVLTSQWCRCRETAQLLAIGPVEETKALNSFFDDNSNRAEQTEALRALIDQAPRSGPILVLVTHQVNITALTGVVPAQGGVVVLKLQPGGFSVAGVIPPP